MSIGFEVNKRSAGVFLTEGDPFGYAVVSSWCERAFATCDGEGFAVCEPYAGKNGLLRFFNEHFHELVPECASWESYDIVPPDEADNKFPSSPVRKRNTLLELPSRYDMIITNPPYLARNSARRRGLDFPFEYEGQGLAKPQDLYQIALDTCLRSADWVCFLIPESFITSRYDKSRLCDVISLPGDLFEETECPVCLALFGPEKTASFDIHDQSGCLLGTYGELVARSADIIGAEDVKEYSFNVPDGVLGLRGVDNTVSASIRFVAGVDVDPASVKRTSRAITRISGGRLEEVDLADFVESANRVLDEWRAATNDVFLTAFKGMRKDGKYRRRLSYDIAAQVIDAAMRRL